MASLKNHPGMWLRDDAAAAINALEDKYGVIRINSAGRTVAEQNDLIRRYDAGEPGIFIPMRPAEESTHVKDGGIAVDVYNYTSDRAKLNEFGFEWFGTRDKVHYTFRGWSGAPASARRGGYADGSAELGIFQDKLIRMGHDLGPTGADKVLGPKTIAATKFEQGMAAKNGYPGGALVADGIPGPATNGYLDWWLVGRHAAPSYPRDSYAEYQAALNKFGYGLAVDNVWGPKSSAALADFQRRHGLVPDRIVGPKTRAALGI